MMQALGGDRAVPALSSSLGELSHALRALHKALLEAELDNFPMARSTFDRLALVVEHPSFAWLHALSELIVEFDELADSDSAAVPTLQHCRDAVERLLGPAPASNANFRSRYLEYLQLAPEVAIATGAVRQLLAAPAQAGGSRPR
ncbi:MAG: hypothetical protein WD944_07350 [Steroidobacteraceae bacterium]